MLTYKTTAVNGTVTASDDALLKDYTVVIFSETPGAVAAADDPMGDGVRVRSGRPLQGAEPAGRATIWRSPWTTCRRANGAIPNVLDRLKDKAKRFTLDEGDDRDDARPQADRAMYPEPIH